MFVRYLKYPSLPKWCCKDLAKPCHCRSFSTGQKSYGARCPSGVKLNGLVKPADGILSNLTALEYIIGCDWRSFACRERRSDDLRALTMMGLVRECPQGELIQHTLHFGGE